MTREPLGGSEYTTLARIFVSQDELRSLVAAQQREQDPKPDAIQVFTRTGILLATKVAIALGENSEQSSNDLTRIGSFLLDVNDFVAGARYRSGDGSADYKALMVEMLASWDLSNPPELLHALGRVYAMLRETALTDEPRVRTLLGALPRSLANLDIEDRRRAAETNSDEHHVSRHGRIAGGIGSTVRVGLCFPWTETIE